MSPAIGYDPAEQLRPYAHPERLVTTGWLAEHLDDPNLVVAESDEDVLLYETGHIPSAVKIDWHLDLNDPVTRDYVDSEGFARLMSTKGITPDTTIVFYGDKSNWWAAYALWVASLFGHADARLLDGGRQKWGEEGRPLVTEVPERPRTDIRCGSATTRPFGPSAMTCWPTSPPAGGWWMCAPPRSIRGSCWPCPTTPRRGRFGAATSRGQPTCPGAGGQRRRHL